MNKKTSTALRVAAGLGLGLSGLALAAGTIYTEIMTTMVVRRRKIGRAHV